MVPAQKIYWSIATGLLILLVAIPASGFPKENELLNNPQKVFECTTCHLPHDLPKFALQSQCQSCHTKEKKEFATHIYPLYLLTIIPLIFMVHGIWSRVRLWQFGNGENRLDQIPRRIAGLLAEVFGSRRLLRNTYTGIMHVLIFYGFTVALIATSLLALQEWTGVQFLKGNVYLWYSLLSDFFGLLAIVGLGMALWKRLFMKGPQSVSVLDDWVALGLLLLIFVQGFVVEGARIAATEMRVNSPTALWSPGGYLAALVMKNWSIERLGSFHRFQWWFHAATAFTFLGYLGFGKVNHIWYGLANIFFRNLGPSGKLTFLDIEAAMDSDPESIETLGTEKIEHYTWKALLDLDACTNCGRCQDVCPAYQSGVPLSPRKLIQDMKAHLSEVGPGLADARARARNGTTEPAPAKEATLQTLFGEGGEGTDSPAVLEAELWGCRTCGACQHECPVFIEHIPKMVDMRRYLVMMESKTSEDARQFLKSMEDRLHPWVGAQHNREEWYEGLDIKVLASGERAEYLFWVGCTGSMIDRNIEVTKAMVKILKAADVDFAVLGPEEVCTGDPARRAGGEFTFQMCAKQNIATLNGYGVKKIITTCPHCFNTYKNEYPDFGGNYEVIHHTELINGLIREGKLKLKKGLESVTYHDPCYLGRHNGVFEAPREVLHQIAEGGFTELRRSRSRSLCCGAGGGYAWMDDEPEKRINHMRLEDVKACGAKTAAVSCPFCMQMFDDALKALDPDKNIRAVDIAELVAEALEE